MASGGAKPVLSIAGLDPSGGAGLLADARVFDKLGLYGIGVLTAVTCQNTRQVTAVFPLDAETVSMQLQTLLADIKPAATKMGMLATVETVMAISPYAADGRMGKLVIDPVLSSTSGKELASSGLVDALKQHLIPACELITPNIHEAAALTGIEIHGIENARQAAREIRQLGARNVCITGGHFRDDAVDMLLMDQEFVMIGGSRIDTGGPLHGTGCLFSAAVTGYLALGFGISQSVASAARLAKAAIDDRIKPGAGMEVPWPGVGLEPGGAKD